MAEIDAHQTVIRGSGGHLNKPKFWLFLSIGDYFEHLMGERIFRELFDRKSLKCLCPTEFFIG
jgi:hypothetical protein